MVVAVVVVVDVVVVLIHVLLLRDSEISPPFDSFACLEELCEAVSIPRYLVRDAWLCALFSA